jgi:hypothetical protein
LDGHLFRLGRSKGFKEIHLASVTQSGLDGQRSTAWQDSAPQLEELAVGLADFERDQLS